LSEVYAVPEIDLWDSDCRKQATITVLEDGIGLIVGSMKVYISDMPPVLQYLSSRIDMHLILKTDNQISHKLRGSATLASTPVNPETPWREGFVQFQALVPVQKGTFDISCAVREDFSSKYPGCGVNVHEGELCIQVL
jgi:hypothetical protein